MLRSGKIGVVVSVQVILRFSFRLRIAVQTSELQHRLQGFWHMNSDEQAGVGFDFRFGFRFGFRFRVMFGLDRVDLRNESRSGTRNQA